MPHNIEKSGFHRGQYVGYGRGTVWRIKKNGEGWEASPRDSSMGHVHGRTLSEVSRKIESSSSSRDAGKPSRAWQLVSYGYNDEPMGIAAYKDKGEAERRMARLKRSHPGVRYEIRRVKRTPHKLFESRSHRRRTSSRDVDPSGYYTKRGRAGSLYRFEVQYNDPSAGKDIWTTWAYDRDHARDLFFKIEEPDWKILSITKLRLRKHRPR